MTYMPRWVRLNKFCELTGYSAKAVHALKTSGKWRLAREYRKVDGRILIDLQAYEKWVESNSN